MHILLPGGGCMPALSPQIFNCSCACQVVAGPDFWQGTLVHVWHCAAGPANKQPGDRHCTYKQSRPACCNGTTGITLRPRAYGGDAGKHQQQQHREQLQLRDDQQVRTLSATCCPEAGPCCAVGPSGPYIAGCVGTWTLSSSVRATESGNVAQQQRGHERRHVAVLPHLLLRRVERHQVLLQLQECAPQPAVHAGCICMPHFTELLCTSVVSAYLKIIREEECTESILHQHRCHCCHQHRCHCCQQCCYDCETKIQLFVAGCGWFYNDDGYWCQGSWNGDHFNKQCVPRRCPCWAGCWADLTHVIVCLTSTVSVPQCVGRWYNGVVTSVAWYIMAQARP